MFGQGVARCVSGQAVLVSSSNGCAGEPASGEVLRNKMKAIAEARGEPKLTSSPPATAAPASPLLPRCCERR